MAITDPGRKKRIDLRLSDDEKATLKRVATITRRTMTSLLQEWVEGLAKQYPEGR